jgi:hypothetical protein
MGAYNFSVGELTSMIKKESKLNLAHLGNTPTDQNTYIQYYMTMAMWKFAGILFNKKTSAPLVVASNGYVTFKKADGTTDVDDMYSPICLLTNYGTATEAKFLHRSSFDAPTGWVKESANDQIHIKGAGTYVLQYRAYPAKASADEQILEWPSTSNDLLIFETIGKIKESLNDLTGAAQAYDRANKLIPVLVKTNMDSSMATTGGIVPSQNEVQYYR